MRSLCKFQKTFVWVQKVGYSQSLAVSFGESLFFVCVFQHSLVPW